MKWKDVELEKVGGIGPFLMNFNTRWKRSDQGNELSFLGK
jgi:hypothetical protein